MWFSFRSLRFRLIAFPIATLALWLALAFTGAIYDAKLRIASEVKAMAKLLHIALEHLMPGL